MPPSPSGHAHPQLLWKVPRVQDTCSRKSDRKTGEGRAMQARRLWGRELVISQTRVQAGKRCLLPAPLPGKQPGVPKTGTRPQAGTGTPCGARREKHFPSRCPQECSHVTTAAGLPPQRRVDRSCKPSAGRSHKSRHQEGSLAWMPSHAPTAGSGWLWLMGEYRRERGGQDARQRPSSKRKTNEEDRNQC